MNELSPAVTPHLKELYERLWDDGIEYYHMARDDGARKPEAVMLQTRGGLTIGGYSHRNGTSAEVKTKGRQSVGVFMVQGVLGPFLAVGCGLQVPQGRAQGDQLAV